MNIIDFIVAARCDEAAATEPERAETLKRVAIGYLPRYWTDGESD